MSSASDKSIEAQVMATIEAHAEAITSGDVDTLLSFYSEKWRDNHEARKSGLKLHFERMQDSEKSRGLTIDLSTATVTLDGNKHHLQTHAEK
jgi:ketosteroid isomerase-like protein